MLDWAGEGQYYAEPKRLARLGYLEAPHRSRYLLIVIDFRRAYLELHEQLIDRVERGLAPCRGRASG